MLILSSFRPLSSLSVFRLLSTNNLSRPSPPHLPREQQQEFEKLIRDAQAPLSAPGQSSKLMEDEAALAMHPDARMPVKPEFEGDVNPETGEQGGPKQEPVRSWDGSEGDWSFKGRVSDF